jgi:C4-dicarboxylate transporter, DctM subunit
MGVGTIGLGFGLVGGLLLVGLPVAVVMVALGVGAGLWASGMPFVVSMGSVLWGVQNENMMTAIPLFILLGEILLRSGLADRMYVGLAAWLGRLPGGLVHTNIGACALFAATCGSSVATAATIGTVALPNLQRRGYDKRQALGSLAAGGTLGILIPPSIAMLVYGSLTNTSIGQLFIAGVVPGILLTLCFMAIILAQNTLFGRAVAAETSISLGERLRLSNGLFPPFVIFGVVMGSLYLGWATPTESAAVGCAIALVLAHTHGRLSFDILHHCFRQTAVLTGMIVLIVCGAFILNVTLSMLGIPQLLTKWVTDLGLTPTGLILILIIFYLILGCFLEVLSMQVTTIPIAFPIVTAVGIDPIWFGVFIVLMSEIAMITPPVGMNLYVVQSIRKDGGSIDDVIWGVMPYVVVMLAFTVLLWFWQDLVLWLPRGVQ